MPNVRYMTESDAQHLANGVGEGFICLIAYDGYKTDEPSVICEIRTTSTQLGDTTDSLIKIRDTAIHSLERLDPYGVTTPVAIDNTWVNDFIVIHGYSLT